MSTRPTTGNGEIRSLTGLRGIAATWVVLYHMHQGDGVTSVAGLWLRHGYLAVDIFFVLSGFVMALSYRHLFENGPGGRPFVLFLTRRVARVWPLYAVLTCLCAAVMAAGIGSGRVAPSAITTLLPLNLVLMQAWGAGASIDHPAWSISAEFAAYLLFPWLAQLALYSRARIAAAAGLAAILALGLLATYAHGDDTANGPLDLTDPTTLWPVLRCLCEFSLGLLAYRVVLLRGRWRLVLGPAASWSLAALVLILLALPNSDLLFVLLVPLLLMQLATCDTMITRCLASRPAYFLGQISYAVYLLHWPLLPVRNVRRLLAASLGPVGADATALVLFYGLLLVGATIAYKIIEMPGRRWIRRIGRLLEPNPVVAGWRVE